MPSILIYDEEKYMKDFVVVIPARLASTRLDRKPLADICGKPMILHTYMRALEATNAENIFVVTDSDEIKDICESHTANVIMTSELCHTGTDRIAEFAQMIPAKTYINLQGDEPLMSSKSIQKIIQLAQENPDVIINGWAKLSSSEEYFSPNIPKVVLKTDGSLMYMSRSPIPGNKKKGFIEAKKQVCIYAFPKSALDWLRANASKTEIEKLEDIEILRFLESNWTIKMTELDGQSIAVDTVDDLGKVRKIMKAKQNLLKKDPFEIENFQTSFSAPVDRSEHFRGKHG